MKKFCAFLASCLILGVFFVTSCANGLGNKPVTEYGSIVVSTQSARSLDVSEITSATVKVSGYGFADITGTVTLGDGTGTGTATVTGIPVGRRVVTVTSNVTGAVLRAVVDVQSGSNPVTVTWDTTAVGNVYYYLIKSAKKEIENIEVSAFSSAIDTTVHPALIDAEAIATDYPSVKASSAYVTEYGTVSVTTTNASGYTLWVTDVASSKKTISSSSENFDLQAYPGSWKVKALDSGGTTVAEKDILVVAGETSTVDLTYLAAGQEVSFDGKTIVFVKATSAPTLWAWETTGDEVELSKAIYGSWDNQTEISSAPSTYMSDTTNWYYEDFTDYAKGGKISFILNKGATIATDYTGTFWYDATTSSLSDSNPSPVYTTEDTLTLTVNSAEEPGDAIKIYVSSSSAPTLWAYTTSISNITTSEGWPGVTMTAATGLNWNDGWYVATMDTSKIDTSNTEEIKIHLNSGSAISTGKTTTFWYDAEGVSGAAGTFYDADPTVKPDPVTPSVSVKPKDGKEVGPNDSITVTFGYGYDEEDFSASVTVSGTVYTWGSDFTGKTFTKTVKSLGLTSAGTISVSASCQNSVGSASSYATLTYNPDKPEDPFTWDNVNCYFVLTDRFYNGDTSNDNSYTRTNPGSVPQVATFHGGDIAGLTAKLDYFESLGVNAIWITAPYEQIHGWVSGKGHQFPHFAFHGYYTLDWTSMDANMGTLEELRTFVNACHSKGIRVVMDIVMNHVGYNNTADMVTFGHGGTSHTADWLGTSTTACGDDCMMDHTNCWYANDTVDWTTSLWETWWGPWIRSFAYEEGSEYGGSCGGLPDVKHEIKTSVGMAPVLTTKWGQDTSSYKSAYYNPSVEEADWNGYSGDYRTDRELDPGTYQVIWLSAWVRELGIDGFRCDTAKHVQPERWGQLKVACQAALEAWREDSTKSKKYNGVDTGAADWDENFWMTGECFGWTDVGVSGGDYYGTGKFDSMINFSFNGSAGSGTSSSYPSTDTWSSYLSINNKVDSDGNGNRDNVLTYISSHDTKLCRASNQAEVGTMLQLTPGGIQIYYGDESNRGQAYTDYADTDMQTRGDFNWSDGTISGTASNRPSNDSIAVHWGKVGTFRKYNPAVGAGTGTAYLRTYSGSAGDNKVAISIDGTSVNVSTLWNDGTTVYNWYDGSTATVSGGSVTFTGGTTTQPILISEKNPADYGITY